MTGDFGDYVTIIWGVERGRRLARWRMGQFLTQEKLAAKLEVTQQVIHSIESGRMIVCERFTLAQLRMALGDALETVLTGFGEDLRSDAEIKRDYWTRIDQVHKQKKRVKKRTNAQESEIDGWRKSDYALRRASRNVKKTTNQGNRTPGPRPQGKEWKPKK